MKHLLIEVLTWVSPTWSERAYHYGVDLYRTFEDWSYIKIILS